MTSHDRIEALARLFIAAGHGSVAAVDDALNAASSSASDADIEETLLLLVPYAGVPRALVAFGVWRKRRPSPAAPVIGRPDPDGRRGAVAFAEVYGASAEGVTALLRSLHPDLEAAAIEDAYGRTLARPSFAWIDRELLATAFLAALGAAPQSAAHARAALRHGADGERIGRMVDLGLGENPDGTGVRDAVAAALRARR